MEGAPAGRGSDYLIPADLVSRVDLGFLPDSLFSVARRAYTLPVEFGGVKMQIQHEKHDVVSLRDVGRSLFPSIKLPRVAVIICNYNQKEYLEATIRSVLSQTYPHLECVIVDDCSTDGSAQFIRALLERIGGGRLSFIEQKQNRGQMAAMLAGFDATTAPFVAWLDGDDIWLPHYIERHMAWHLNSQINAALSTSNLAIIDRFDAVVAGANSALSVTSPLRKRERICSVIPARLSPQASGVDFSAETSDPTVFVNRHYEPWIWSPTSGIVFRRAAVESIRPPETDKLRICADLYLARFSHLVGGTLRIGETLGYYRMHGNNGWANRSICGDGAAMGKTPTAIVDETDYQFARRLSASSEVLTALISKDHLRTTIRRIARKEQAIVEILSNKDLLRIIPIKLRIRLFRKFIFFRFRNIFARAQMEI